MVQLFQVDAFTDKPFRGNPAGVCLLKDEKSDQWMLHLAREMNLSETAFLLRLDDGYSLRWFTPTTEVSLCGHATLASAHILWEENLISPTEAVAFHTKSGVLQARQAGGVIELDFPARQVQSTDSFDELNQSLNISPLFTGKYPTGDGDLYLLQVASDQVIKRLTPDFQKLQTIAARAVIVTSASSDPSYDFVSRFFAPAVGINEDPVTGSAHCYLTPYWGTILGKKELVAYQASDRSGVIHCEWLDDRVLLGGHAVTIFKADLLV